MSKSYVYDLETYPNLFLAVFFDIVERKHVIFDHTQLPELRKFLKRDDLILYGYNNILFDDRILYAILTNPDIDAPTIANMATVIITKQEQDGDEEWEVVKEATNWNRRFKMPSWGRSIDLAQILGGFASKKKNTKGEYSKATDKAPSLKALGVRERAPNVKDLPVEPGTMLDDQQQADLREYCKNDVEMTYIGAGELKEEIAWRWVLTKKFGKYGKDGKGKTYKVDVVSSPEARVGEAVLSHLYRESTGLSWSDLEEIRKTNLANLTENTPTIEVKEWLPDWLTYNDPTLQAFVDRLRTCTLVAPVWQDSYVKEPGNDEHIESFNLEFGGVKVKFGFGGAHTDDVPSIERKDANSKILDFDVNSYYPNLVLTRKICPRHLDPKLLECFQGMVTERLAAKKKGDKATAQGLKIVVNVAGFGKYKSPYAFVFDPLAAYEITFMGQLYLFKLMDMVMPHCKILSINTDGITVRANDDQEEMVRLKTKEWESLTQLSLEENEYECIIRKGVNSYVAKIVGKDELKTKGEFNTDIDLKHKCDALIIPKALVNYFVYNTPLQDTFDKGNVYDYLFSSNPDKRAKVFYDGVQVTRTNRYYVAKDGKPLVFEYAKSKRTADNGASCRLMNHVTDESIPNDIDYDFYRNQVLEVVQEIENKSESVALELRDMGLTTIEKVDKRNPGGATLKKITNERPMRGHAGLGCVTGPWHNTICIDIDRPELVDDLWGLIDTSTMIVWRDDIPLKEAIKQRKRIKLFYLYDGEDVRQSDKIGRGKNAKSFLEVYGFEILYGKVAPQIWGLHTSGKPYQRAGTVKPLNPELRKYLIAVNPPCKAKKKVKLPETDLSNQDKWQRVLTLSKEALEELKPGHWDTLKINDAKMIIKGHCPFEDTHTTPSNNKNFDISLHDDIGLQVGCFHSGCKGQMELLKDMIVTPYNKYIIDEKVPQVDISPNLTKIILDEEDEDSFQFIRQTIEEAMASILKNGIIMAATGAGKSWWGATLFCKLLLAGETVCYVASNLTELKQVQGYCKIILGMVANAEEIGEDQDNDDINDFPGIFTLRSNATLEDGELDGSTKTKKIPASTRGLLTHHTYLGRRGFSLLHYPAFWNWTMAATPLLILDEVDSFCEKQSYEVHLQQRYTEDVDDTGTTNFYRVNECKSHAASGAFQCGNCHLHEKLNYNFNQMKIWDVSYYGDSTPFQEDRVPKKINTPTTKDGLWIPPLNMMIHPLYQHANYEKEPRFFMKGDKPDFNQTVRDIIDSSCGPYMAKHYAADRKGLYVLPVDLEQTKDKEGELNYPYSPCDTETLIMNDVRTMRYLDKYCRKVIMLSATPDAQMDYLKAGMPDLQVFTVPATIKPVKELWFVAYGKGLTRPQTIKSILSKKGDIPMMIFANKKKKATSLYHKLKRDNHIELYDGEHHHKKKATDTTIHYNRGALARGANLGHVPLFLVDASGHKPPYCYNPDSEEDFGAKAEADMLSLLTQVGGRQLRKSTEGDDDGRRIILMANVTQEMAEKLVSKWSTMADSIRFAYFKWEVEPVMEYLDDWVAEMEWVIRQETKLTDIPTNQLGEKQRKVKKNEIGEIDKMSVRLAKVAELKAAGMTIQEVARKMHFSRMSVENRAVLQQAYLT